MSAAPRADVRETPVQPTSLNGIPRALTELERQAATNDQRGSFTHFGAALGPSATSHPGFSHHANSAFVDLNREYEYPPHYRFLQPLAAISACTLPVVAVGGLHSQVVAVFGLPFLRFVAILYVVGMCSGFIFCCCNIWRYCKEPASDPQPLSRNELRHLLGRTECTFFTIVLFTAGLFFHAYAEDPENRFLEVILDLMKSLASIAVLLPSWYYANKMLKEPIKAGHVMSFFWSGALFSAYMAGEFNTSLMALWGHLDVNCHMQLPVGPKWPFEATSVGCVGKATVQWILTPGIVEESFKFAVLLRLVPTVEEAVKSRMMTRCPRWSTWPSLPCCGWFLKLAASPVVVLISGMAVGAGFATMENVAYIQKASEIVYSTRSIWPAMSRVFTGFLHIGMTGTCSFFLAESMFSGTPRKHWCFKYIGLIIMVFCHGVYDAFCTFQAAMPPEMCFGRVVCSDAAKKQCTWSNTGGELGACKCVNGTDPDTFKCVQAGNLTYTQDLGLVDAASAIIPAGNPAEAASDSGLQELGGVPIPLHTAEVFSSMEHALMTDPISVASRIESKLPKKIPPCPLHQPEMYVCGPPLVEWWPCSWASWVLGTAMIAGFAVLCYFRLPSLESSFHARQNPPQTELSEARLQPGVV